jgi:hypothetical protein
MMAIQKVSALGFLVFMTGCTGEKMDYVLAMSPDATQIEVAAAQEAAAGWNACGITRIVVHQGNPMTDDIPVVPVTDLTINGQELAGWTHFTGIELAPVLIDYRVGNASKYPNDRMLLVETFQHEMGHMQMGTRHTFTGVMKAVEDIHHHDEVGPFECKLLRDSRGM